MPTHWTLRFVVAAFAGLIAPGGAAESESIVVAQSADCELARDMWSDIKSTTNQGVLRAFISQAQDCPVYVMLAEELLGELGGAAVTPLSTISETQSAPIIPQTECDRQAGYPFEPRRPGLKGINFSDINASAAIAACRVVRAEYPEEKFFSFLLARAYLKADLSDPRAVELVREGMEAYEAFGLSRLGSLYGYGDGGLEQDYVQAAHYAEQSCQLGNPSGCNDLGFYYQHGDGVTQSAERAVELYDRACSAGASISCFNVAEMYKDGSGVERDVALAADYFGKACDAGSVYGCGELGYIYKRGLGGVARNSSEAFRLLGLACEGGITGRCGDLADYYWEGDVVEMDFDESARLFRIACEGGSASACDDAGWWYSRLTLPDYSEAARLYGLACDGEVADGCYELGLMLKSGIEVGQDYPEAVRLFRKACDMGPSKGCYELGDMYVKGLGTDRNIDEGIHLLSVSCRAGNWEGCLQLGTMYDTGTDAPHNPGHAMSLLENACRIGGAACDRAAALRAELGAN